MTRPGLRKSGSVSSVYMRDKPPETDPEPVPEETTVSINQVPDENEEEDEEEINDQATEIDAEQILATPLSLEMLKDLIITLTKQVNLLKLKVITNKRNYKKQVNTLRKKLENHENNTKTNIQSLSQNMNKQLHQQRNLIEKNIPAPELPSTKIIHDSDDGEALKFVDDPDTNTKLAQAQQLIQTALTSEETRLADAYSESNSNKQPPSSPVPTTEHADFWSDKRRGCEIPPPPELSFQHNTRKKIDALLVGSSIVKHIRGGKVKKKSGHYLKVCSYPGATSEKVKKHTNIELEYYNPKSAIVYAGGNDLAEGKTGEEVIIQQLSIGQELRNSGVRNIFISSMTPRVNLVHEIQDLNYRLERMCLDKGYIFIDNSNISFRKHICSDGVHLNFEGVDILSKNISYYLRNVEPEDEK